MTVSVLIPSYNHGRYIRETIRSIADQTHQEIELIVIDDCSTDDSYTIAKQQREKFEGRFLQFIIKKNEQNLGIQKSLNKAARLATGHFIFIIASDDALEPNAIDNLLQGFRKHPNCGIAVGKCSIIDENGSICYWDSNRNNTHNEREATYPTFSDLLQHKRRDVDFLSDEFGSYSSLLKGNYIPPGILIPKPVFEAVGGYDEGPFLEDYNIALKISKRYSIKYFDVKTFRYRWHSSNTVKNPEVMVALTKNTLINEIWFCKSHPNLQKSLKKSLAHVISRQYKNKFQRSAIKRLATAKLTVFGLDYAKRM